MEGVAGLRRVHRRRKLEGVEEGGTLADGVVDGVSRAPGEGEGVVEGARRRRRLLRPAGPRAGEELVFAIGLDRPSGDEAPAMKQIELTFQKKNSIGTTKLPCKSYKSQMK